MKIRLVIYDDSDYRLGEAWALDIISPGNYGMQRLIWEASMRLSQLAYADALSNGHLAITDRADERRAAFDAIAARETAAVVAEVNG